MFGVFVFGKLVRAFFTKDDANKYKETLGKNPKSFVRKCTEDELYEYDSFGNLGEANSAKHDLN